MGNSCCRNVLIGDKLVVSWNFNVSEVRSPLKQEIY